MTLVLITRPREDAQELAELLRANGFEPLSEPLLHVEPLPQNRDAFARAVERKPDALLITSKRGLEIAAQWTPQRNLPILCVGESTAQHATGLGFAQVQHSLTVHELANLVREHWPKEARFLYARAEDVSVDLAGELSAFSVESIMVYRATAIAHFSSAMHAAIAEGKIASVLFFSQRTAATYAQLAAALAPAHEAMQAICISEKVASALAALPWKAIKIADQPDMKHMLAALNASA